MTPRAGSSMVASVSRACDLALMPAFYQTLQYGQRGLAMSVLLALLMACGDPQQDPAELELSGETMGTYWQARIVDPPAAMSAESVKPRLAAALAEVNAQMSTYDPDSELSRFNRAPVGEWFPVSEATARVVDAALDVSDRSDGAFDATVGPLVDLWGFGAGAQGAAQIPDDDAIAEVLKRVNWRAIEVDTEQPALRRTAPVELDLSAIAKGYGVDLVAKKLEAAGARDFLVDIGGEMRGRGVNGRGEPWRIGVEVPDPGSRGRVQKVISLRDSGLATSGDYRNFFMHDGIRYAHIIDPRQGWPVPQRVASVTVIHRSAMMADAWATALTVMAPKRGMALAQRISLPVLFVLYNKGELTEQANDEFRAFVAAGES